MKHIHLIPADFEYYNLDDLKNERDGNDNGVCWSNGLENGKKAQAFNIGDIVYIYFHDSKGLTDRILLKATVYKSDCTDDGSGEKNKKGLYSEYCDSILKSNKKISIEDKKQKEYDAKAGIKGFYLKDFVAISEKNENDFKYKHGTKEDVKKGLTGISVGKHHIRINQTKIYLDKQYGNGYDDLLNALKLSFKNRSLESLRDKYNNDSCIVCTKTEIEKYSFKKPNNLYYYEIHHILQQNLNNKLINKRRSDDLKWFKDDYYEKGINTLVYNEYNEVRLCPYHHNILHYGQYEKRKEILDKIMEQQDYKNKLKIKVKNEKDCNDILEYIYKQYGISYKQ